jgi:ribonuclease Y
MTVESIAVSFVAGVAVVGVSLAAYTYSKFKERALRAEFAALEKERAESMRRDIETAQREARTLALRDLQADRSRVQESEQRLNDREAAVIRQLDRVVSQEGELRERTLALDQLRIELETKTKTCDQLISDRRSRLELASQLNAMEARTLLLKEVEQESSREAAELARSILDVAREGAEREARRILAIALQRYAGRHTFETTTATLALNSDDMKGRIIGRDGRNIRAFEAATGVTVLVDDTPNAVVLSGFDPVRREIARQAMERLILDGRIHPARIEEVVQGVTQEMDAFILRAGEDAVYRASQPPMPTELVRMLGRLHFRHSFTQNVLQHSVEVAHLCGLMAAEMGESVQIAKRAGLLHDIGKAMTHEIQGPHALVGADFVKSFGEDPIVINAVASHHDEVPHESVFGLLVSAADAISASRPGSRSENMTTYIARLENLEKIAMAHDGVEKAFAVQAGRELRVIVRPDQVTDQHSLAMARDIARQVEDELLYPGQIRVTVIRETRCVEYAK